MGSGPIGADCKGPADARFWPLAAWLSTPSLPSERSPGELPQPISGRHVAKLFSPLELACFRPIQPQAPLLLDWPVTTTWASAPIRDYGTRPTPPSMLKASGPERIHACISGKLARPRRPGRAAWRPGSVRSGFLLFPQRLFRPIWLAVNRPG